LRHTPIMVESTPRCFAIALSLTAATLQCFNAAKRTNRNRNWPGYRGIETVCKYSFTLVRMPQPGPGVCRRLRFCAWSTGEFHQWTLLRQSSPEVTPPPSHSRSRRRSRLPPCNASMRPGAQAARPGYRGIKTVRHSPFAFGTIPPARTSACAVFGAFAFGQLLNFNSWSDLCTPPRYRLIVDACVLCDCAASLPAGVPAGLAHDPVHDAIGYRGSTTAKTPQSIGSRWRRGC
jgi:hypothetical protein